MNPRRSEITEQKTKVSFVEQNRDDVIIIGNRENLRAARELLALGGRDVEDVPVKTPASIDLSIAKNITQEIIDLIMELYQAQDFKTKQDFEEDRRNNAKRIIRQIDESRLLGIRVETVRFYSNPLNHRQSNTINNTAIFLRKLG